MPKNHKFDAKSARHYNLRLIVGSEATPPKKSIPQPEKVTAVKEKPSGECFTLSRSGGAVLTSLRSDKTTTPPSLRLGKTNFSLWFFFYCSNFSRLRELLFLCLPYLLIFLCVPFTFSIDLLSFLLSLTFHQFSLNLIFPCFQFTFHLSASFFSVPCLQDDSLLEISLAYRFILRWQKKNNKVLVMMSKIQHHIQSYNIRGYYARVYCNQNIQGGDYVPVRQKRGPYEAVIEFILKMFKNSYNLQVVQGNFYQNNILVAPSQPLKNNLNA